MDQLGKALPEAQQRDSGRIEHRNLSTSPSAISKRNWREKKRKRLASKAEEDEEDTQEQHHRSMTAVIEEALEKSNQNQAINTMKNGIQQTKHKIRIIILKGM